MHTVRILGLAILLFLLVSCVPDTADPGKTSDALSEERGTVTQLLSPTPAEDFLYSDNGDGTLTLNGYTGDETHISVPSHIDGKPVTVIGRNAFASCRLLERVVLPSTVRTIGVFAFHQCESLAEIQLGDGLERIEDFAFSGCTALTALTVPAHVTYLPENAVNAIRAGAAGADLRLHFLGDAPEKFYDARSNGAAAFSTVTYEAGAEGFSSPYWYGYRCHAVGDDTVIPTYNGFVFEENAGGGVTVLKYVGYETDVTVPETLDGLPVTEIGIRAFADTDVVSVHLPDTVEAIGDGAFCHSTLRRIDLPDSLTAVGDYAFGFSALETIDLPRTLTSLGPCALTMTNLTELYIPGSVGVIPELLVGIGTLQTLTLGEGITGIGASAFAANALTAVILPRSLRSIGAQAFGSCWELEHVTLPHAAEAAADAFPTGTAVENTASEAECDRFMASEEWEEVQCIARTFLGAFLEGDRETALALSDTPDNPDMQNLFPDGGSPLLIADDGNVNLRGCITDGDGRVIRAFVDIGVTNDLRPEYTYGVRWFFMTLIPGERAGAAGNPAPTWCVTRFGIDA